jgi:hypothetical protein
MNRIVVWAEVSMLGRDELQRHLAENVLVDGILGDRLVKQSQMCCNLVWTLSFRGKPDTAADIAEVGEPGPPLGEHLGCG